MRIAAHLESRFARKNDLKEKLENIVDNQWEQTVILRLTAPG